MAVTHPSTNQSQRCLTSVISWELVCQRGYGIAPKKLSVDPEELLLEEERQDLPIQAYSSSSSPSSFLLLLLLVAVSFSLMLVDALMLDPILDATFVGCAPVTMRTKKKKKKAIVI